MDKKKAVIVGGSNGIGLAISKSLIEKNYYVYILDICEPDKKILRDSEGYKYCYCNLLDFKEDLFLSLEKDENISLLMLTAGFGRVAGFEYLHIAEIQNLLTVNTVSIIKIIRLFYDKIKSNENFYCGVMGSIAGWCSSPMFSVYAASKAAICRFVESVNIELEVEGYKNRILNISPGSIKGTKFNGEDNDIKLTNNLAEKIIDKLFNKKEIYIPEYEKIYKNVLDRYYKNPKKYGIDSYNYKVSSGRIVNENKVKIGYLSGTFDLFHIGHLNLLKKAKAQCDYLIVGVHPNAAHKGKETFISFEERKKIIESIRYVDKVVQSCPEDSEAWNIWHYNKLFVGSDYKGSERFKKYEKYFADKNVEIVYFPYTKGTSSTQLRSLILDKISEKNKLSL
ncbi:SDR family NAD(P)-dependent oxidoreductase [Megamonas funiformis]|jgi:glycerol-3-phosphate cytidylyltransferase|uniref:SDR family NAD(P)-dependent oxidoreductase n=1 Tax=Megamonas funiformis TaxID=437897 RepID=UPI0039F5667A